MDIVIDSYSSLKSAASTLRTDGFKGASQRALSFAGEELLPRLNPRNYKRSGSDVNFVGKSYQSSKAYSGGELHARNSILKAFRNSTHTETSQAVLNNLDNGVLKVRFSKSISNAGFTKGKGVITVNRTMNMDDILTTIVHEGQHELDIASGLIRNIEERPDRIE